MRNVLLFVAGIVLLGGLFLLFRPKTTEAPQAIQTQQKSITTAPQATSPEEKTKTFKLVISERVIVSGSSTLTVHQGDEVTITITSDEKEEFHLHAYDNSVDLEPNKTVSLTFTADKAGRFPFELEDSQTELGALEVLPK